jgi:hypothetical protein
MLCFYAAAELYDFDDDKVINQCRVHCLLHIWSSVQLVIHLLVLKYLIIFSLKTCVNQTYFFLKEEDKPDFKKLVSDNWIEPPRRERKRKYVRYLEVIVNFNYLI